MTSKNGADSVSAALERYFEARRAADDALLAALLKIVEAIHVKESSPSVCQFATEEPRPGEPRLPLLLRIKEAASELGVCEATVYNMIHAGELPSIRIRGKYRIPSADLPWRASSGQNKQQ